MSEEKDSNTTLIVISVALALAICFILFTGGDEPSKPKGSGTPLAADASTAAATDDAAAPQSSGAPTVKPISVPESTGAVLPSIAPGKAITVESSDLPTSGPLTVTIELPNVHEGEPLTGRVITEGRHIEVQGVLEGGDGSTARIDVPTDWLEPGTYLIEMHIREESPIPLRRYVLVIR